MVFNHRAGAPYVQPTWSLCAEVFLYLLLLLMVCFIPRRHIFKAKVAAAANQPHPENLDRYRGRRPDRGFLIAAYMLPVCRMDGFPCSAG